jgi:hypothetical protein
MQSPQLTAVFVEVPESYIGFVKELPGANTQGDTLEEARENLREAVSWSWKPTGPWPSRTRRLQRHSRIAFPAGCMKRIELVHYLEKADASIGAKAESIPSSFSLSARRSWRARAATICRFPGRSSTRGPIQ